MTAFFTKKSSFENEEWLGGFERVIKIDAKVELPSSVVQYSVA